MKPIHVEPKGDLREHVTNGDPCACMARECDGVVVHNSFDRRETGDVCRKALDLLALAMAYHEHTWTAEERAAYEHAMIVLNMHWPARVPSPPEYRGRRGGSPDPRSSD